MDIKLLTNFLVNEGKVAMEHSDPISVGRLEMCTDALKFITRERIKQIKNEERK